MNVGFVYTLLRLEALPCEGAPPPGWYATATCDSSTYNKILVYSAFGMLKVGHPPLSRVHQID